MNIIPFVWMRRHRPKRQRRLKCKKWQLGSGFEKRRAASAAARGVAPHVSLPVWRGRYCIFHHRPVPPSIVKCFDLALLPLKKRFRRPRGLAWWAAAAQSRSCLRSF